MENEMTNEEWDEAAAEHGQTFEDYTDFVGREYVTLDQFEEAYNGHYCDGASFAEALSEDLGAQETNEWPFNCIDWDLAWQELEIGGDYFISANGHVFRADL